MDQQSAQSFYNTLIKLANVAYQNSQNPKMEGLKQQYYGKAEAYEYAARLLDAQMGFIGIIIQSKITSRASDVNQGREEDSAAEAQYEMEVRD